MLKVNINNYSISKEINGLLERSELDQVTNVKK